VKVTDKRMLTDDGKLREEYRHLEQQTGRPGPEQASAAGTGAPSSGRRAAADPSPEPPGFEPRPEPLRSAPASAGSRAAGTPGFMDLVAFLVEPIALFLGDAQLPDGTSAEDLPRARLQIDLLAVLQEKTRGNVSADEAAVVDNLLAQLRMRFVEKSRNT